MAENSGQPLRFIKKIPNSAAAPSYKLTLPHAIVDRHLRHLIGRGFELASSPHAFQTWEGSLSSRRNKMRAEYVLQGWKLFAEAHKLEAGDQVSFELIGSNRLVVKCIQPASALKFSNPLVRNSSDSPDPSVLQPSKSFRTSGCCSPSQKKLQNSHAVCPQHSHASSIDWLKDYESCHTQDYCRDLPFTKPYTALPQTSCHSEPAPLVHHVQSWLSLNLPSPHQSASPHHSVPIPTNSMAAQEEERSVADILPLSTSPESQEPMFQSFTEQLQCDLPGIFDDISQDLDSVVPDIPVSAKTDLDHDSHLPSLSSSLSDTHVTQPSTQEDAAKRETELRALVSSIQDRLDQSTRSALQATMGLENCVMFIVNSSAQKDVREVQAKMFRFLSSLKESLWQVLVVANNGNE